MSHPAGSSGRGWSGAPGSTGRSRRAETRGEKMRLLRFLVTYVIVTVLGGVLLLFLALNHYTVQLDVFGPEYSVSIALLMLGAAALGFVVAMLIVLPGRIASAVNARRLDR